jgi:hypothetical protein
MTSLHFDCFSGISGDMVLGALVDLGLPLPELVRALKPLSVPGSYRVECQKVLRGGIQATKVEVIIQRGFRSPVSYARVTEMIRSSRLPKPVKERSLQTFDHLGRAESQAHGVKLSKVHFHEVGAVDSLIDVIGSLLGCHLLGVEQCTASAVNVGSGFVDSAHGKLPVPGPAVVALSQGVPIFSAGPQRELTTPTGIALLRTLVSEFVTLPLMRLEAVGCGAGTADPPGWPNLLRVFRAGGASVQTESDTVIHIETNLDDLNPQAYESVMDRLFSLGAVDVTLTPVIMKHGRPGVILTALASREKADPVVSAILRETTTLGVRVQELSRRILPRHFESVRVAGGEVRMKVAVLEGGKEKAAPEYQDCKRIAEQTGRPVREIMEEALLRFSKRRKPQGRPRAQGL